MGGAVPEDKGKLVEDVQSKESREVMLVENFYHVENLATDREILARLERELQATFRFKDREG